MSSHAIQTLKTENERIKIGKLLNSVFREDGNGDMLKEYPTLISIANSSNIYFIEHDQSVVSHIAVQYRHMHLSPSLRILVAEIGAVATDNKHRGKGYASRILARCVDDANARGAQLMLISGDESIYLRAGAATDVGRFFKLRVKFSDIASSSFAQSENDASSSKSSSSSSSPWSCHCRLAVDKDLSAIGALLSRGTSSTLFAFDFDDVVALFAAQFAGNRRAQWFVWAADDGDRIEALLVVNWLGDGRVMRVLEFVGARDVLPDMVRAVAADASSSPRVETVTYEVARLADAPSQWLSVATVKPRSFHGTVLALNVASLLDIVLADGGWASQRLGSRRSSCITYRVESNADSVALRFVANDQQARIDGIVSATRFLLGAGDQAPPLSIEGDASLIDTLALLFPLPFRNYGLAFI
jgi:predicted N-acetyltransferase YhbS